MYFPLLLQNNITLKQVTIYNFPSKTKRIQNIPLVDIILRISNGYPQWTIVVTFRQMSTFVSLGKNNRLFASEIDFSLTKYGRRNNLHSWGSGDMAWGSNCRWYIGVMVIPQFGLECSNSISLFVKHCFRMLRENWPSIFGILGRFMV